MGSYWAGYSGSALVLKEKEFGEFLKKYNEFHETDVISEVEEMEETLREYPFIRSAFKEKLGIGIPRCFYVVDISTDDCDGMHLIPYVIGGKQNNPGNSDFQDARLRAENLYVIFSDRQLNCASALFERPYESYESLVLEFKDKLAKYLPVEFYWDMHIGGFYYASYA